MEPVVEYLSEAMETATLCYFKNLHHGNRIMNVVDRTNTIHLRSGRIISRSELPALDHDARKQFLILRPVTEVFGDD